MRPGLKDKEIQALVKLLSNQKHEKYIVLIGSLCELDDSHKSYLRNNQIEELWVAVLQNFGKPFINLAQTLNSLGSEVVEEYLESKFKSKGCSDVEVTRAKMNNYLWSQCACKHNGIWDPKNQVLTRKTISVISKRLCQCGIAVEKRYAIAYEFGLNSGVIRELGKDVSSDFFFLQTLERFLQSKSFGATLRNVLITLESFELNYTVDLIQQDLFI